MKKACKMPHLRAPGSVSERAVCRGPWRGSNAAALATSFAQLFVLDRGRPAGSPRAPAPAWPARGGTGSSGGGSRRARRAVPARTSTLATPSRAAISAARCVELEGPDRVARVDDAACRRARTRAGHALRAIAAPTAAGHASTTSPIPPCGPKRAAHASSSPSGSISDSLPVHAGAPPRAAPARRAASQRPSP